MLPCDYFALLICNCYIIALELQILKEISLPAGLSKMFKTRSGTFQLLISTDLIQMIHFSNLRW